MKREFQPLAALNLFHMCHKKIHEFLFHFEYTFKNFTCNILTEVSMFAHFYTLFLVMCQENLIPRLQVVLQS